VISPGGFLVLASNMSAFFTRYGFQPFGEYTGQLDNSGETLALNTMAGDTLIEIHYNDRYPWPNSADGDGYSLVPREQYPYKDQNDAANWMASSEIHGNPGRDDILVSVQEPRHRTIPDKYQLLQNYPNPFNAITTIQFQIPKKAFITIRVYDVLGREVDELVSQYFEPGYHSLKWDASCFASGVYFYRLQCGSFMETKKLVILR
jgi:hypothetical protein